MVSDSKKIAEAEPGPAVVADDSSAEEVIEDIRSTLFEPMSDIEGDEVVSVPPAACQCAVGNGEPVAPVLPAPTQGNWEAVEIADSDRAFFDKGAPEDKLLHLIVKTIMNSRSINFKLLSRQIPSRDSPTILAKAINMIKHRTTRARSNAGKILSFFASLWIESEKRHFFIATADSDFFAPSGLNELLRMTEFDLPTIMASNHENMIARLKLSPPSVTPFLKMLG